MRSGSRQKSLVVLLSALVVVAAWRFVGLGSGMDRVAPETPISPGMAPFRADSGERVATLFDWKLDGFRPRASAGRDPWQFVDPPARPVAPEPVAPQPVRQVSAAPPVLPVTTPAEFPMKYLGRFGPADRKIAVFSAGPRIINALEGEVLEGGFVVSHIGYESVEIRFLEEPERPARRVGVHHR